MKRFIICLMLMFLISAPALAFSQEGFQDGFELFLNLDWGEQGEITIMRYTGSEERVVIPEEAEMNGQILPVVDIAEGCFKGNSAVKTIIVPNGVLSLQDGCFEGCPNLERVVLPEILDYMGDRCLADCPKLSEVLMPYELYQAGEDIFAGCDSLVISDIIKDVITNTVSAVKEAHFESIEVNESNLFELTSYIGMDFYDVKAEFGSIPNLGGDMLEFMNDYLRVSSYNFDKVHMISILEKCDYSLCGIHMGMSVEEAGSALEAQGLKKEYDGNYSLDYVDAAGNMLSVYRDKNDRDKISSIVYALYRD